jgi:hypothetical protein
LTAVARSAIFAPERKGPMRLAAWRYRGSRAGSSLAGRRLTVFSIGVAFLSVALTALLRRLEQLLQLLARHGKSRAATFRLGSRALQWDTFG